MRGVISFLVAGAVGGTVPLLSQTPKPTFTEAIVVTATLAEEASSAVTATTSVVDSAEAEARQASTLVELLATIPGLSVVQSGSPGKVAALFTRGAGSNQTLVLEDGVRLNDPYLGGFDWAFTAPDDLARVEVVRGPFSALYGSSALGGVVQLVTRRDPGLRLRLEGGERDYLRGSVAGGVTLGGVALSGSAWLRRGEGLVDNDDYRGGELSARLDGTEAGAWSWGLGARRREATIGLPYDFFGTPAPAREQEGRSLRLTVPLGWQGQRTGVELRLAAVEEQLALTDPADPWSAGKSDGQSGSARVALTHELSERFILTAGGEWRREEVETTSAFGPGLSGESQRTGAAFVQSIWRGQRLRLEAGLRHDTTDAFGGATSARGGLVLDLGAGVHLRANLGQAFRAPSLADLYYPGFGNPELEPERGRSAELGLEARRGALSARLTGFSSRTRDLIQFDFATFRPENIGRAKSRGVEAEVGYRRGSFDLRSGLTWLDAVDATSGARLLRRPEWSGSAVATGAWKAIGWHLVGRYVGSRRDVGEVELPAYSTLDAGVTWRGLGAVEPYLRLTNLFDATYEEAKGYPAMPRTLVGGVVFHLPR